MMNTLTAHHAEARRSRGNKPPSGFGIFSALAASPREIGWQRMFKERYETQN